MTPAMEIKVSISARVIIQDGNVNVNEILHEAGKLVMFEFVCKFL